MRNNNLKKARKRIIEFFFPNGNEVKLIHRDNDHIIHINDLLFGPVEKREIEMAFDEAYLKNPGKVYTRII